MAALPPWPYCPSNSRPRLADFPPTEIAPLEVLRSHANTTFAHHGDCIAVKGKVHLHRLSGQARIESVIDQLHEGVRGRPVISEKRGRDLWVDPLSNRYPTRVPSHEGSILERGRAVKTILSASHGLTMVPWTSPKLAACSERLSYLCAPSTGRSFSPWRTLFER